MFVRKANKHQTTAKNNKKSFLVDIENRNKKFFALCKRFLSQNKKNNLKLMGFDFFFVMATISWRILELKFEAKSCLKRFPFLLFKFTLAHKTTRLFSTCKLEQNPSQPSYESLIRQICLLPRKNWIKNPLFDSSRL